MDWKLTKLQWLFIIVYSMLFPILVSIGGVMTDVGIFIYIPFLPLSWIGGTFIATLFKTQSMYPVGLFLAMLLQVLFVIMNLRYYFKQKKSNIKKFIKHITLILLLFFIGIMLLH